MRPRYLRGRGIVSIQRVSYQHERMTRRDGCLPHIGAVADRLAQRLRMERMA